MKRLNITTRMAVLLICSSCMLASMADSLEKEKHTEYTLVSGTVKADNGEALPYATLQIVGKLIGTTTDKDGNFSLRVPKGKRLSLQASYLGFSAQTLQLKETEAHANFVLREDLVQMNEVVVTATRTPKTLSNSPIITRIISAKDIARQDATNIASLLQSELPGIEFGYAMNQQTSVNMQGFGGTSVLFLIDGERMAGETLDNVDYNRFNLNNIDHIEIVKGSGSSLYGSNAIGAVVNIITKENQTPWSLNVSTRYGSHKDYNNSSAAEQKHNLTWGLKSGAWNNMFSVQNTKTDSYDLPSGDFSQIYGGYTWHFRDQLTFRPTDKLKIIGKYGYFFRQRDYQPEDKDRYRDFEGGLKMVYKIDQKNTLEANYRFDQYDKSDYYPTKDKDIRDYSNIQNTLRVFYTHAFNANNTLSVGGDLMSDYLMSYQFEGSGNHTQYVTDAFVQYDWNLTDQLNIVAGLRGDSYSQSGFRMSPKVSLKYKPSDHLTLRAGYAQGFRAPTLKEMYMNFDMAGIFMIYGNKNLKSELSHNLSLSAEFTGKRYSFTASGYYNNVDNRITTVWNQTLNGQEYYNSRKADIIGADATASVRYPCGLGAKLSYAYTHEFVHSGEHNTSDNRPHSATLNLNYGKQFKNYAFDVSLNGRYMSDLDVWTLTTTSGTQNYEKTQYPAYMMWKLVATQRLRNAFKLTLTIDNLFNYKPDDYHYNSPMTLGSTVYVGLSVDVEKLFVKR